MRRVVAKLATPRLSAVCRTCIRSEGLDYSVDPRTGLILLRDLQDEHVTEKRTSSSTSLIKGSAPPSRQVGSDSWSNFSYRGRVGRIPLLIDKLHPYETVERLRDVMAQHGGLYDNGAGVPVRIRSGRYGKFAQLATKTIIVLEADKICQPYVTAYSVLWLLVCRPIWLSIILSTKT